MHDKNTIHELEHGKTVESFLETAPLVLVQFGSATCLPCHAIRGKIDAWVAKRDDAKALYVSVEDHPEETAQADVLSVPTVRLYVEGKLAIEKTGYFSLDRILSQAERYANLIES